ncbi:LOW QUALITY PROTEIN: rho guanine nucleotide exchange factor 28 [Micropterus salmoides]|uniref:LOW QUALITY PROTEIN: rho guanine nucleotide exchange factor 28 n=1 Tax=Micropterus salmoides TaxID=27706 RepID=UPI0018ED9CB6|nr:LOW QUALITY PROTEIN: rho guanine nucleotide exchange factor 28 [Micropterus salmoides]
MEVNRREVPLYGQVEAHVRLQASVPEDAEFYVVVQGSGLTHVTAAKTGDDGLTLIFTVPGHALAEAVSVTSYFYAEDQLKPCEGEAYLEYLRDVAQEAAEYLSANRDQLGPQSYLEVLKRFSTWVQAADEELSAVGLDLSEEDVRLRQSSGDEAGLRHLDEKITQAMANMDYPQQWQNTDSKPREAAELQPKETLLHLAVRLGLVHLSRFLIHQPRGQRALTLPNQEGDTPLQLAQKDGQHAMFRMLAAPPGPVVGPVPGVWCVWSDKSCMLRFCPGTDSMTLTVRQTPGSCSQDDIMIYRDRLGDQSILKLINELKADSEVDMRGKEELPPIDEGIRKELRVEEQTLVDNVFEEQLVLSLDDDDDVEEYTSLLSVNGHPMQASGDQIQFTQCATDPLLSMINSSDQTTTQPTQPEDDNIKYSTSKVSGVTRDSTGTDSGLWDTVDSEDLLLATDTPPPYSEDFYSVPCSPPLSPADQALVRLNDPASSEPTNQTESLPMDTCDLSPSLVALEVDSEEDGTESKSPLSPLLSDVEKSEDKRETFYPSPDLTCTRSQSPSSCEPTIKESGNQGIRLRSYSYSSSKISLRPACFARYNHTSDINPDAVLHSVSHSRSLLQALSLSKSLSLLHPGKQRASSISEQSHEKREIRFRKRAQSADDEGSMELAESLQHLTLSEFLKEIEEEELDKYNIPTKVESEKYKVIRTFSFLKSRMSSTRNKTKGKGKDREAKDRQLNGHRLNTGSCLGPTVCVVCEKPASGKDLLHCSSCTAIVHKGCKESLPPCLKKLQDKYAVTMVKNRTASLPQNFTVRDSPPQCVIPTSTSLPVMAPKERKDTTTQSCPLSGSFPNSDSRLSESSETESDAWKVTSRSEELLPTPLSSTSADSSFGEDCVDTYINSDMSADAVDYEAESWSLTVEHKFCKKQDKRAVKRQDVIYELMQTELHHLQTLHIMAEVFRRGMKEEVQLDTEAVERVFPCLDQLLLFHHAFFAAMKERRQSSAQPHGHRNYLIQRIGDVLLQQFSDENKEKMKQVYGDFCSRHNEAVSFFKELQQHNKRFQIFIKQQGNNSLVRRREIPECILLVTQRITKYPVLLERILQYTQEETEEHADISQALIQIREVIAAVDLSVSEYERHQRLQEVWNRMENRSTAKLKNGYTFRKQDMMGPGQTLKHQGLLLWKTATGRLKDVLALLLIDTLIFLQEKDQKYTFATVDQKPPVVALQKLIVREVANEERGMFLISASTAGPEMYEVHTSSKEERNTWMRLIREAVESCPEEEEEYTSESEEEKRAAEARTQKIQKFQENLMSQDQRICSSLEEKLQLYAELSALSGRTDALLVEPRLLFQPHSEELPQAAVLLAAALQEAENLKATLSSRTCSPSSHSPDSDTDSVFPVSPATLVQPPSDSEASPENPETREGGCTEALVLQSPALLQKTGTNDVDLKVAQSVQSLMQLLYSLQAMVTIQDSCYEVQRLLLQETGRPSPRAQRRHLSSIRGNTLQEQEKQRNLEKRKEEVAATQRLQGRLRQEKERWERECQARESQQGEQESRLEERERQCHLEAERLRREREELDEQLEEYQQSLERLREGQRNVERERERLENQQKLFQTWSHSRQRSLPTVIPHMVIPLDGQQDSAPRQPRDHTGNGSMFVNEAAFTSTSVNNRHVHHKRNDPSAHNCLNTLLARSNSRQPPIVKTPHSPRSDSQGWMMGTGYLYSPAGRLELQHTPSDHNSHSYIRETWSSIASGTDPYPVLPHPSEPQLDLSPLVSLETDSGGEESSEETIVYL